MFQGKELARVLARSLPGGPATDGDQSLFCAGEEPAPSVPAGLAWSPAFLVLSLEGDPGRSASFLLGAFSS